MENEREVRRIMMELLEEYFGPSRPRLAPKWCGGKLVLHPESELMAPRTIEIEVFFHKIVMLRESLRVLEQKINNHPKLNDEDRVQLQHYISRVYGTLTTFNMLFAEEDDRFIGQKGEGSG